MSGEAFAGEPAGTWEIRRAHGPGIPSYQGEVVIQRLGRSYRLRWDTSDGAYEGVGLRQGWNLYVGWGLGRGFGVVRYEIARDGSLAGQWLEPGSGGLQGREWATPVETSGLEGRYALRGRLPGDLSPYEGVLYVEKVGRQWSLRWEVDGTVYTGVGLKRGRNLVAAWGPEDASGLAHYRMRWWRARGRWVVVGKEGVGLERLRRRR